MRQFKDVSRLILDSAKKSSKRSKWCSHERITAMNKIACIFNYLSWHPSYLLVGMFTALRTMHSTTKLTGTKIKFLLAKWKINIRSLHFLGFTTRPKWKPWKNFVCIIKRTVLTSFWVIRTHNDLCLQFCIGRGRTGMDTADPM